MRKIHLAALSARRNSTSKNKKKTTELSSHSAASVASTPHKEASRGRVGD